MQYQSIGWSTVKNSDLHVYINNEVITSKAELGGVLRPVQQPGSYWDRSSASVTCGSPTHHTGVTVCAWMPNLLFIYLFGVLHRFQHCTGHITTGSWKDRGNQYIEFARVLYCKLPTNGKQLPAFPHKALTGIKPRPQRWEVRVLPLCHRGPTKPTNPLGQKLGSQSHWSN